MVEINSDLLYGNSVILVASAIAIEKEVGLALCSVFGSNESKGYFTYKLHWSSDLFPG